MYSPIDKFSKLEQGDYSAYTMIASMRESELLKAIQESEELMGLFKVGRMCGKRLWVFNGDIDWEYYLKTEQFRVKSDENNLRGGFSSSTPDLPGGHPEFDEVDQFRTVSSDKISRRFLRSIDPVSGKSLLSSTIPDPDLPGACPEGDDR